MRFTQEGRNRLAPFIRKLAEDVSGALNGAWRVPVLGSDPPPESAANLWMLEDGRLRGRNKAGTLFEYAPAATPGAAASAVAVPPVPELKSYYYQGDVAWAQTFNSQGLRVGPHLYFGYSDAHDGINRTMLGLDLTTLRPALAGARITRAWLRLSNLDREVDVTLGVHASDAPATVFSQTDVVGSYFYEAHEYDAWRQLPVWPFERMRDSAASGLTFNNDTDNPAFYGYAAGLGDAASPPRVKIEYVK